MKNKADLESLLRIIIWVVFFIIALFGVYYLVKKFI